jgi:hypothetical protein
MPKGGRIIVYLLAPVSYELLQSASQLVHVEVCRFIPSLMLSDTSEIWGDIRMVMRATMRM